MPDKQTAIQHSRYIYLLRPITALHVDRINPLRIRINPLRIRTPCVKELRQKAPQRRLLNEQSENGAPGTVKCTFDPPMPSAESFACEVKTPVRGWIGEGGVEVLKVAWPENREGAYVKVD